MKEVKVGFNGQVKNIDSFSLFLIGRENSYTRK